MVVEELVEGGLTRLAAFYYSDIPTNVGPDPVDARQRHPRGLAGARLDGDQRRGCQTIALIKAPASRSTARASKGIYRSTSARIPPYNLLVHLNEVAKTAKTKKPATPPDYLTVGHRQATCPRASRRPRSARSSRAATPREWQFTNGSYHNLNSNAPRRRPVPGHERAGAARAEGDAGYLDPAGNPVPETLLIGKGNALLFHNGRMVAGELAQGQGGRLADQADHQEGRRR